MNFYQSILFILLFIGLTPTYADVTVARYQPELKIWEQQVIPGINLKRIDQGKFYSAGKYAWAIDTTEVAFFNGVNWENSVRLPEIVSLKGFYPGYPISGEKPVAWVLGLNAAKRPVILYFDGKQWNKAWITHNNIDMQVSKLSVSNGHAWAIGSVEGKMNAYLSHTDINAPTAFSTPKSLPIREPGFFESYNDSESYSYALGAELIRINDKGEIKKLNPINKPKFIESLLVRDNVIIMSGFEYKNNIQQWVLNYSIDNGNTWFSTPALFGVYFQSNLYNNNVCVQGKQQYACIKLTAENPEWQTFETPISLSDSYMLVDANGAWIVMSDSTSTNPYVYRYDMNSKTLTDTHFQSTASTINWLDPFARIINNQLILRSHDQNGNHISMIYDGNKWISSNIPLDNANGIVSSLAGNSLKPLYATDNGEVWAYSY